MLCIIQIDPLVPPTTEKHVQQAPHRSPMGPFVITVGHSWLNKVLIKRIIYSEPFENYSYSFFMFLGQMIYTKKKGTKRHRSSCYRELRKFKLSTCKRAMFRVKSGLLIHLYIQFNITHFLAQIININPKEAVSILSIND